MEKVNYEFIEECKKELAEIVELIELYKYLDKKTPRYKYIYVGKITPEYNFWEDFLGLFGYKCEDRDIENSDNSRTYLKDGFFIRTYNVYYMDDRIVCEYGW